MSNDQMALTGFERVDTMGDYTDYAQTWLCEQAVGLADNRLRGLNADTRR